MSWLNDLALTWLWVQALENLS